MLARTQSWLKSSRFLCGVLLQSSWTPTHTFLLPSAEARLSSPPRACNRSSRSNLICSLDCSIRPLRRVETPPRDAAMFTSPRTSFSMPEVRYLRSDCADEGGYARIMPGPGPVRFSSLSISAAIAVCFSWWLFSDQPRDPDKYTKQITKKQD